MYSSAGMCVSVCINYEEDRFGFGFYFWDWRGRCEFFPFLSGIDVGDDHFLSGIKFTHICLRILFFQKSPCRVMREGLVEGW